MPQIPPQPRTHPLPFRAALPALVIFMGLFFINFAARVALGPYLPIMEAEFGIGHAQSGGLFLPMSAGMSLVLVLSSLVAGRLGHRRTILISTFSLGAAMIAVSQAPNLALLRLCLLGMGMAAGLYFPSALSSITGLLQRRHWGRGLAVHELAPNLAFIVVPAMGALLADVLSWRTVFAGFGVLGIVMGLVFIAKGRGGEHRAEPPCPKVVFGEVLSRPVFWVLVFLFSLAVAAGFGPYSMLALYLVDKAGMNVEQANTVLMASRVAGPAMALASGLIVDRIGARTAAALSLGLTGLMAMALGLASGPWLIAAAVAQPVLAMCYFPAGLTAVSMLFPERLRNIAISLIVPVAVLFGSGLTPPALGWFGDQGQFALGFVCLGGLITAGVVPLLFLRLPRQD